MSWQQASVLAIALGLAAGCAEHLHSLNTSAGWSTGVLFWPPPDATSRWIGPPAGAIDLGDARALVARSLRDAGYADLRWFPIGVHYDHGFAVTTQLEQVASDGAPESAQRWPSGYADAVNLRWLAGSQNPYLPRRGRYRALLVAFTDLHIRVPGRPQRFDESTAMDGPDLPVTAIPDRRRVTPGYRVGVYIYEYEAKSGGDFGTFVTRDENVAPTEHLQRSHLSALLSRRLGDD